MAPFNQSFKSTVSLPKDDNCKWSRHYQYGATRDLLRYIEMLAAKTEDNFVFVGLDYLRKHCKHPETRKQYSKRHIRRVISELQEKGILSYPVTKDNRTGWFLIDHSLCANSNGSGQCHVRAMSDVCPYFVRALSEQCPWHGQYFVPSNVPNFVRVIAPANPVQPEDKKKDTETPPVDTASTKSSAKSSDFDASYKPCNPLNPVNPQNPSNPCNPSDGQEKDKTDNKSLTSSDRDRVKHLFQRCRFDAAKIASSTDYPLTEVENIIASLSVETAAV